MTMSSRERVLTTLEHREPDRVPLSRSFDRYITEGLKKHYGVGTDRELDLRLGIDFPPPAKAVAPEGWKPTPDYIDFCKRIVDNPRSAYADYEEWGIRRELRKEVVELGQGTFIFTRHPWESFTEVSQVEEVELPDLDAPGRWELAEKVVREYGEEYLVWGDLGHVLWTKGWELRGMYTFMKDLYVNERMATAILDRLLRHAEEACKRLLDLGCDGIRVAEDWGTQTQLFINVRLWRKYFKPRYERLFRIPKKAGAFVYFHSDGNITPIVGELIDCGVDVLNPVQPECMDPVEVKRRYGDRVTIHTGCSVQRTLPYGTVDEVRREVLRAIVNLAPGGGFIYGTSHRVLYNTPIENVVTLFETCLKYGRYPIKIDECSLRSM